MATWSPRRWRNTLEAVVAGLGDRLRLNEGVGGPVGSPQPLVHATSRFVTALTPVVRELARDGGEHPTSYDGTVTNEAVDLISAFIDADAIHTDAELDALVAAAGPWLPGSLVGADAATLRRSGLVSGRRAWLTSASELMELLVAADRRDGGHRSWIYYKHACEVAHAVAATDVHTSQAELDAVARFRSMLLTRITAAGIDRPAVAFFTDAAPPPKESTTQRVDDQREPISVDLPPLETPAGVDTGKPGSGRTGDEEPVPEPRPVEVVLAELDELVGLKAVKAEVRLLADLLTVQQMRRDRGLPVVDTSLHLVFTGNPGTGKTTVGRLLAEIYASLGLLERGHLVEADRASLVAGFVGQTATKTQKMCEKALGGMLLIDEAYALARGNEQDFGLEAIDTLVKYMEDHREDLAVIVAGYPAEMATFINANPGLASRFPKTIHFPDYATGELVAIFELIAGKKEYRLGEGARQAIADHFDAIERGRGFGNGREARNLFEASIARHASRLVKMDDPTDEDLTTLLGVDIRG